MSLPPPLCPNCQTPWPPSAEFCPNCGLQRPPAVWPPSPSNFTAPLLPPVPKLVTGKAWGDITLGIFLSFAANFVLGIGVIVMPILYFTLKPNYPIFARGIGYGLLTEFALLLGAFAWCLSGGCGWHP